MRSRAFAFTAFVAENFPSFFFFIAASSIEQQTGCRKWLPGNSPEPYPDNVVDQY